ncbi:MAG TPA: exodeoxyribonuclease III [Pyrinomonadaceae bacterium]|jgi:exodeoxyribonuclease-3
MKIATWNVNSVFARMPHIVRWIEKEQPDVLCLQETKTTDDKFPAFDFLELGYNSAFIGQKSYNGVAILSRHEIADVQYNFPDDAEDAPKRLIAATVNGIRIVNTYIPNGTELWSDPFKFKLDWLQRLRHFFEASCDKTGDVLLCGDFNVAPDERDVYDVRTWEGKLHFSRPERAALDYVKKWGFVDAFRLFHEAGGLYSWWNYREGSFFKNNGLRIDHIWVSPSLAARCLHCEVDKSPRGWERPSDHAPVVAVFSDKEQGKNES